MKNINMLVLAVLIFPASVLADTWAFDSNEKIHSSTNTAMTFEVVAKSPSWTFDEKDGKLLVVDYDSYAFQ